MNKIKTLTTDYIVTLKGGSGFVGTGRACGGKFSTSSAVGTRLLAFDLPRFVIMLYLDTPTLYHLYISSGGGDEQA